MDFEETATELLEDMLEEYPEPEFKFRGDLTRERVIAIIALKYQEEYNAYIEEAMEEARWKASRDWRDNGLSAVTIDDNDYLWETSLGATEAEADAEAERQAEVRRAEYAAKAAARVAEIDAAILTGMRTWQRYRYNSSLFQTLGQEFSVHEVTVQIGSLVANGSLTKIERTANDPPYLVKV